MAKSSEQIIIYRHNIPRPDQEIICNYEYYRRVKDSSAPWVKPIGSERVPVCDGCGQTLSEKDFKIIKKGA